MPNRPNTPAPINWDDVNTLWNDVYEWEAANADYAAEQHIARNYGDCGRSILLTEDYFEMQADDARANAF